MINYLTTSLWFITASVLQAAVLWIALSLGLTSFNPGFTAAGLIGHLVVGQVAGYLLYSFLSGRAKVAGLSYGVVYGIFLWVAIALLIAPGLGLFTSPLVVGVNATLTTLAAFLVYGAVAGYGCQQAVEDSRRVEDQQAG